MAVNGAGEGKSLNYSLDFTGGTSMTATLGEYIDVTGDQGKTLRADIEKAAGPMIFSFRTLRKAMMLSLKLRFWMLSTEKL